MNVYFHALPVQCPNCGSNIIDVIDIRVRADAVLRIDCLCHRCGEFHDERPFQHWCLWAFIEDTKPETEDDKSTAMLASFKPTGKPN